MGVGMGAGSAREWEGVEGSGREWEVGAGRGREGQGGVCHLCDADPLTAEDTAQPKLGHVGAHLPTRLEDADALPLDGIGLHDHLEDKHGLGETLKTRIDSVRHGRQE